MWVLVLLVFGGIVGWLASAVVRTSSPTDVRTTIILGMAGAGLGNWLGGALGLGAFGSPGRFLVAMLGAMALIAPLRALRVCR